MKKFSALLAILVLAATVAIAFGAADGTLKETYFTPVGGTFVTTPGTLTSGTPDTLHLTSTGALHVSAPTASGATSTALPLPVSGLDNLTLNRTLAVDQNGVVQVAQPIASNWYISNVGADATTATATKAAGATGVKHVATCITFSLAGDLTGAASTRSIALLDGASTLWSGKISIPATAGSFSTITVPGCWIGTAATAMSVTFTSAQAAVSHAIEACSASGYDTR